MAKKRSLIKKRRIFIGGQQQTNKDLYNSIVSEGNNLYNSETSSKNNSFPANDILFFVENFYQDLQQQYNTKQQSMLHSLQIYGESYTSYFTLINANLNVILAEAKELLDFTINVNIEFTNQKVHIHLLNQKFSLLTNAKLQTNTINATFQESLKIFDSIIETIKNDYPVQQKILQQTTSDIEIQTHKLQDAISMVNRPPPLGFIPKPNTTFIQGCPLGTVLVNGQCNYYSDISNTNLLESVPFQSDLSSNDYVIWFNNINQTSVGNPTLFKKKQLQYLLKLTVEDSKVFNVKYVVSQDNGVPYKDNNGFYKFVSDIRYGWNQSKASLTNTDIPGFDYYYIDYDGTPQQVKVLDNPSPILRNVETQTKYISPVSSINYIVNGIQYVETDISGNMIYDLSNNSIPFYPNYYEYTKKDNVYSKVSYNNVDIITYNILSNIISLTTNKAVLDITSLDKFSFNQVPSFYKNKLTEFSIPEYYSPFIFPQFFNNTGDYFLIQNTGSIPIIFDISKTEDEKRVVVYPKQLICFVSSSKSPTISYGFLNLDTNLSLLASTKNVALVTPYNIYAFVETQPLYDNGEYIMQQTVPLFDSEGNIISVPNFDPSKSVYYEYDDIFLSKPINVSIITPESRVINDKTYTSMNYPNTSFSLQNKPYVSKYVCPTNYGNIFVFCNENGIPNMDILGYLIPVPSLIYYVNNSYIYYSMNTKMPIEIKDIYNGAGFLDKYISSQLQTEYSSLCQNTPIYTNQQAYPILYDNKTFIITSTNTTPTNIIVNLPIGFQMIQIDLKKKEFEMKNLYQTNRNKVYSQNTNLLIDHYKDLSGSMNNLKDLSIDLNTNIQQMVLANNLDTLNKYQILVDSKYKEVLDTYSKLKDYEEKQKAAQALSDEINKYKTTRQNELTIIKGSIVNMTNQLNAINSTDADVTLLRNTLEKLKTSFNIVNVNIDSSTDLTFIQSQEKSTQILLKGIQTLQSNINAYNTTNLQKQQLLQAKDLEEKQKDLQSLSSSILETPVDTFTSQLDALPLDPSIDTLKQNIKTSIQNIQTIIDSVKSNTIVAYTNDTITKQIGVYQNNMNSINLEKQNIQQYLQQSNDILMQKDSQQLVTLKATLNNNINSYQTDVNNVRKLLDTLPLTLDQKTNYESQLNNSNLEVQTISTINATNVPEVQGYISRVAEIDSMTKQMLTQLQTLEMAPAPTQKGGKRRSIKSLVRSRR